MFSFHRTQTFHQCIEKNYICCLFSEYEIEKKYFYYWRAHWLHAVVACRRSDPPLSAAAMQVRLLSCSVICNGTYFTNVLNTFHSIVCDYDITKQIYVVFLLQKTAHCCRASLERPAFPNGSHVRLFSYTVIYQGTHFTSLLNFFTYCMCEYDTTKQTYVQ